MTRYVARRLQALRAGRHRSKLQNDANDGFRDSKYFSFACDRFFFAHCGYLGMTVGFCHITVQNCLHQRPECGIKQKMLACSVYQISAPVGQKAVTLIGASTILKLFGGMGPMGISAPIPCDMVRQQEQWDHTGAESKRLRFESLSALLDLTWTVASIAKVTDSARLREVYERTAFQGHGIAQRLISEADGSESAALETKWNVVCQAVAEFETGESRVTPRHAEQRAAGNYVEGSSHTSVRPQRGPQIEQLTKREVEVLKWVAEGKSTKEVAGILGTSFKTAACHRYRVMDKLGIHDAVSLTRYAIRNGLIQP